MGAVAVNKDHKVMEADLNYWKPEGSDNRLTIDFTKPGAEQEYDAVQKLRGPYRVNITDIRGQEGDFNLDFNGFQYVGHDVPGLEQCKTEEEISNLLLPATEELVKRVTGAERVVTFTHRVRSKATDDNKRADNKAPALSVHSDFTPAGALSHLKTAITDSDERERLLNGRVCIFNVWRPLKTIDRDPLTVCDWTSSKFDRDWVAHRFVFPHGWNELGAVKYSPQHKWYYLNGQKPSEPLIFKQFDSDRIEEGGQCVAHTAFSDPAYADAPARESIEIKMFAFLPEGN